MNTSKTLSTRVVTVSESTGSRGMLRRAGGMDTSLGACLEVEHELHRRPPLVGIRLWCTLLERCHQLVPARGHRFLIDASKVSCWFEGIIRNQRHEHAPAAEKNLHLVNAALAQPRGNFGPHRLMITAVFGDFGWIVL